MQTPRRVLALIPALLLSLSACTTSPTSGGGADPCIGQNPAALASAWQGVSAENPNNIYTGKDSFTNHAVKKGTVLYSLTPGGTPGFAVDNYTLTEAGGKLTAYYELLQVSQDPGKDASGNPRTLRQNVRAYEVTTDLCAAFGKALMNPQFGKGGGSQYYIGPADAGKLSAGAVRPI